MRAGLNRGTHNVPTASELAVLVPNDSDEPHEPRQIRVKRQCGGLLNISHTHGAYMPLHFVLPFPFGELGWASRQIPHAHVPLALTEAEAAERRRPPPPPALPATVPLPQPVPPAAGAPSAAVPAMPVAQSVGIQQWNDFDSAQREDIDQIAALLQDNSVDAAADGNGASSTASRHVTAMQYHAHNLFYGAHSSMHVHRLQRVFEVRPPNAAHNP